jgi:hypothetical protein
MQPHRFVTAGCLRESFIADQQCGRIGPQPRGQVQLQLLQDGFTLKGCNSLGALQVILPRGDGDALYKERLRGGGVQFLFLTLLYHTHWLLPSSADVIPLYVVAAGEGCLVDLDLQINSILANLSPCPAAGWWLCGGLIHAHWW